MDIERFLNSSIKQYGKLSEATWKKIIETIDGEEVGRLLIYIPKKYIVYKKVSIASLLKEGVQVEEDKESFIAVIYGEVMSSFVRNNGVFYKILDLKSQLTFTVYFRKSKGLQKPKIKCKYYFIGKVKYEDNHKIENSRESNVMMFFPQFKTSFNMPMEPVYARLSSYYRDQMKNILQNILNTMSVMMMNTYMFKSEEFKLNRYTLQQLFAHIHIVSCQGQTRDLSLITSRIGEYRNVLKLLEYTCFFYKLTKIKNIQIGTSKKHKYLCELDIKLTKCQIEAIRGISKNLAKEEKTINFLQGDVGTGKTLVAFVTIRKTLINGYNACFMSPTGILANQHYANFKKYFPGVNVFMIESGYKSKDYLSALNSVIQSQIPTVFFGTHSLLYEKIPNIQYVVIDEQHKFGMEQRKILMDYYVTADVLFLSATPIPRTLFLLQNKQMELFTLHTNPFPRQVKTTIVHHREEVLKKIIKMGQDSKVLWINGAIEESEYRQGVKSTYEFLKKQLENEDMPIYLIHGKMSDHDKVSILNNFHRGILVATICVETGVDLPNLPLIIIEEASNFGLATLHQLRGRVGRQGESSECILIDEKENERLRVLIETDNGLKIAEMDLRQRGYGSFFQKQQWGFDSFKSGKLNSNLFRYASQIVEKKQYHEETIAAFNKFFLKIEDVNY